MLFGQIESEARQLLARASILAEAKAANPSPSKSRSSEEASGPSGNAADLYSFLLARFRNCRSSDDFEGFCEFARGEIDGICKATVIVIVEETPAARTARMLQEGRDADPNWVARKFNCGPRDVIKARELAGLDPATGKREKPQIDSVEVRRALVRQRAAMGLSVRDIEKSLGVPKSIVHRDLAA